MSFHLKISGLERWVRAGSVVAFFTLSRHATFYFDSLGKSRECQSFVEMGETILSDFHLRCSGKDSTLDLLRLNKQASDQEINLPNEIYQVFTLTVHEFERMHCRLISQSILQRPALLRSNAGQTSPDVTNVER